MNLVWVAALLVVHPVLDGPEEMRLVATGTGDHPITWHVDGEVVANSSDGQSVSLPLDAGAHEVTASTEHEGPWRMLVRPQSSAPGEARLVQAWTATAPGGGEAGVTGWIPAAFLAVACVVAAAAGRRPKRP